MRGKGMQGLSKTWSDTLERKKTKTILLIITFTILLYLGLQNIGVVAEAVKFLVRLLSPFIIGLCIAFIVNVLMRALEERVFAFMGRSKRRFVRKLRRPLCLVLSVLIILGMIAFLLIMIVPEIQRTVQTIANSMPTYIVEAQNWVNSMADRLELPWEIVSDINWTKAVSAVTSYLQEHGASIFNTTIGVTTSVFVGLFNFILGFVFAIYLLMQKEKIGGQFKRLLYAYIKKERVDKFLSVMSLAQNAYSRFVTGQLTEAVIIGVLCFIGMLIFSMPYATLISTLIAFTALIPMIGAFIGTAVGALLILMVDPIKALLFIIVLQQFESNLIYPRVVGKSIGLPGIWVLTAVTIGGSLFGILGILLSVPLCSVIYTLLSNAIEKRLQKKRESGELSE